MSLEMINTIKDAARLEAEGDLAGAAATYEGLINRKPSEEQPYNRLMVIYRQMKRPGDELRVIKFAITVFEAKLLKKRGSKKMTELSNAIIKSAGLGNGKGKLFVYPEPLGKWHKRMEMVEKKLKK
jgi:hypothetical protein